MKILRHTLVVLLTIYFVSSDVFSQGKSTISINGTKFELNGKPFEFTGVSFFNAIYNHEFNRTTEVRKEWIRKFNDNGINVFRVWCQWDNARGFVDGAKDKTMFEKDGSLVRDHLATLVSILEDADKEGTIILLVLFSRESWNENIRLSEEASEKAVEELTGVLIPFRNVIFQIWNEFDNRTIDYFKIIKNIDPDRIVTNSPGYAGYLGSLEENRVLDYLSPHTTRDDSRHWEVASGEVAYLIEKFRKPVVDDEPARKGTSQFGGPKNPVVPTDHILHIYNVWNTGGYIVYHHDMFQMGYGDESIPPNGIPSPGFSSYHDQVFSFLKNKQRYLKQLER